jgi:cytochrome c556
MRTLPFVAMLAAALVFGCSPMQPAPPPFKPVADVKQMMDMLVDPAADEFWSESGQIITAAGVEQRGPKNNEEWTKVQDNAMLLAESGNLLMMSPRAQDGDQWMKSAQALVDKGKEAYQAAQAKDVDRMFAVGGEIYDTCLHCHQLYMPAIRDALKGVNK